MNSKKTAAIIGVTKTMISTAFSFILTPIMLLYFGKESVGVYNIVLPISAYFALLDLGMHNVVTRYTSKYRYENDIGQQRKYIGISFAFYLVISAIILCLSIGIYYLLPMSFSSSLNSHEINLLQDLFIILAATQLVKMVFYTFKGILKAYEKFVLFKTIQVISVLFRGLFALLIVISKGNIIQIAYLDLTVNIVLSVYFLIYVVFKLKLTPQFKNITYNDIKEVFSYSIFIFINMLALQLFWSTDNIVLGVMTSSTSVAIYSQGTLLNSYFNTFSQIFSEFLLPSAVKLVNSKPSKIVLGEEVARIGRLILVPTLMVVLIFSIVGKDFMFLWLGKAFEPSYYVALIVMIPQVISSSQVYGTHIMWAKGLHKKRAIPMLIISLINMIITVFLVDKIGIIGAAIGTCFAFVMGYLFYTSYYYDRHVGIDMKQFYILLLRKILYPIILTLGLGYMIKKYIIVDSWTIFILSCIVLSTIYILSIYIIYLSKSEISMIKRFMVTIAKKLVRRNDSLNDD